MAARGQRIFTACLRNADAVAHRIAELGGTVSVIPAGERWPDGGLRPVIEDLIGAGAVIHRLKGDRSPEAGVAEAAYLYARDDIGLVLNDCASGRELAAMGFSQDVARAAEVGASACVPVMIDGAYRRWSA